FGSSANGSRRIRGAGWQFEEAGGERVEIAEHLGGRDDIGVFGVHVAEAEGVAGFAAVEAALFGEDYAVIEAERIDDGGAHAARGRRAGHNEAVAAEQGQIRREVR